MSSTEDLKNYLDIGVEAAYSGGRWLSHFWGFLQGAEEKSSPSDLVTEADRASEKAILEVIKANFPSHSILCEESGIHGSCEEKFLWVIDPLDGTTNYTHQYPWVAVSIALLIDKKPAAAIVYNPIHQELFTAIKGQGAYLNGRRLHVSKVKGLSKALLATGFAYDRRENPDNNYNEFFSLTQKSLGVRRGGAAALDLAYVAAGRLEGYWERGLQPWDMAAGWLLILEAGGNVSSYEGEALDIYSGRILSSNSVLHQQLKDALHQAKSC